MTKNGFGRNYSQTRNFLVLFKKINNIFLLFQKLYRAQANEKCEKSMKSLFFQNKFLKLFLLFHNTKIVYYSYSIHLKLQISHKNLLVNPKRPQKLLFTMNFKFKYSRFFVFLCNSSMSLTALSAIWFDLGISIIDSSTDQCVFKHLIAFSHFVLSSALINSLYEVSKKCCVRNQASAHSLQMKSHAGPSVNRHSGNREYPITA